MVSTGLLMHAALCVSIKFYFIFNNGNIGFKDYADVRGHW
jgi:hypothetical protein